MDKQYPAHILKCHPMMGTNIIKANNTLLSSAAGKELIDFESGIWCAALGHNPDRLNGVIVDQLQYVSHLNTRLVSDLAEKLAVDLLELVSFKQGKAVFLSSGSEAVEMAITLARLATDKPKMLSFSNSYLSAYSHMTMPRKTAAWLELDLTQCNRCPRTDCYSECPIVRDIDFSQIAAFVLEPGNSGGRVLLPTAQLVEYLADNVQNNGGKVVVNEVTTGFGRTGKWFGYNHYNLQPDLISMGKALGNGYPISAVVMTRDIAATVESQGFKYAQSHQNDPLGCRIAAEVIQIFKDDNIIQRSEQLGSFFVKQLRKIENPLIKEVRGRGMMIAIELNCPALAEEVFQQLYDQGFYVGCLPYASVVRFYPALTIEQRHIVDVCQALTGILNNLTKDSGSHE